MDWELIAFIIVTVLLIIGGGYVKKITKEFKEFFDAVSDALQDDQITKEELAGIFKEAKDIGEAFREVIFLFVRKVK